MALVLLEELEPPNLLSIGLNGPPVCPPVIDGPVNEAPSTPTWWRLLVAHPRVFLLLPPRNVAPSAFNPPQPPPFRGGTARPGRDDDD